jgi:hypothetical protein
MTEEQLWEQIVVLSELNKKMAKALSKFAQYFIDIWDCENQDGKNQVFMKGPFSGGSCGSVVEYAKKMKALADEVLNGQ